MCYAADVEDSGVPCLILFFWDTQGLTLQTTHTRNPQWCTEQFPVMFCLQNGHIYGFFFPYMSSLSIFLLSQDELNQIMETNLWLRHVSLRCMTVKMDLEQGHQVWIQPSVIHDSLGLD